jgi:hypothetical protein
MKMPEGYYDHLTTPQKHLTTPQNLVENKDYPVWNPKDGVWQGPDGSKTTGYGPTWINPDGKRSENIDGGATITDKNQQAAGWREAPKSLVQYRTAPNYEGATNAKTKEIWEEPTLHSYPYFNPFTGATHNVDGSRTVCNGAENDDCRTITTKSVIDNWWGNDPRTANPYPPNAPSLG